MRHILWHALILTAALVSGMRLRRQTVETSTEFTLDVPIRDEKKNCTWNGREGVCVAFLTCNPITREIEVGGNILGTEERSLGGRAGDAECGGNRWCCFPPRDSFPATSETPLATPANKCTPYKGETNCPWCVTLHKGRKGKIFCVGAMIGTKVVLTAATCLLSAQDMTLTVRAPNSADPGKDYQVTRRNKHDLYSSGSHANDFGLLELNEDVNWGGNTWKGACLGQQTLLKGSCTGFGFNANGNIVQTSLDVAMGGCSNLGGDVADAGCGTKAAADASCNVETGSPIVCGDDGLVVGVSRLYCRENLVLLGDLDPSRTWLVPELEKLQVQNTQYVFDTV